MRGSMPRAAAQRQSTQAAWPYELSAASLLAAGVLAALGRNRRQRLWQRGFGRRLVAPDGEAAVAEAALRIDAGGALAPYPGLVSLGMNDTGRIMVDLEVAHGLIAVRGPADTVRSALAA